MQNVYNKAVVGLGGLHCKNLQVAGTPASKGCMYNLIIYLSDTFLFYKTVYRNTMENMTLDILSKTRY